MTGLLLEWLIKIAVVFAILLTAVAYLSYMERRVAGWIQIRVGPNRVGPLGLLQPLADGLKFIFKEDIVPLKANKLLYIVAPAAAIIPALMTFIVIPYGSEVVLFGKQIALHVTRINVALLYVLGLTSLSVYGIVLAGWSSNNKYSLMGGLRASAQLISYELALGMAIIGVLVLTGSLDLVNIVEAQRGYWFGFLPKWNIFLQPVAFVIFFLAALAETNRVPFDLPEAEAELVAGYFTEYSSMKFAMFFMSEYLNLITSCSLATTLFFGGWTGPGVNSYPWLSIVYFVIKVFLLIFLFMWIRFTFPRFRYDQLMRLGWKFLLPTAIANVVVTSTVLLLVN
ncbi:MAG: NADH-quinone oxidoreductase subunit NuoH [Blastocatellia bacterium AA13]|nr:MAG: NADH-quinone oxidoreductase subunit NuoH [Blastocatellia bacterium AA13]